MATLTATKEQVRTAAEAKTDATVLATGVAGAAMLAGGIGALFIGIMTTAAEVSDALANSLKWVGPVGPLSGKTGVAVIVWLLSWVGLNAALKHKDVDLGKVFVATLILIVVGILLTFPPVFEFIKGG